jgi:hypothetical protein
MVERDQARDHAERITHGKVDRVTGSHWNRITPYLQGQASEIAEQPDCHAVVVTHDCDRAAVVSGVSPGQFFAVVLDRVRQGDEPLSRSVTGVAAQPAKDALAAMTL